VSARIGCWSGQDREAVTIADLLEHSSGLPGHRPYFKTMTGRAAYERAICEEPLEYTPRSKSIYSDLGFILLGFILEDAADAALDAQFDVWRRQAGIDAPLAFTPLAEWRRRIAPTEQDEWRGRLLVGEVHDENASALHGVAGHAGLFGTARGVGESARWWMSAMTSRSDPALQRLAVSFVLKSSVAGSSRALGWDRMLTTSSCGTKMSARAIGHTAFTGPSLWIDPERDVYFALLNNRVHPTRANDQIQQVRRAFHDAVIDDLQDPS
jgi:CubicO group peptidase (beta-lactamase class C family)